MCISHSVMEGQRHNNALNPRYICLERPKRDGTSSILTHVIVEVAKALRGSFKFVTLAPKTVREMNYCSEGSFLPITWQVMTT